MKQTNRKPSRIKFAIFVAIFVYPLVMCLQALIGPFTSEMAMWQRNLIFTPLMVVSMVFGIIPFIQQKLGRFL